MTAPDRLLIVDDAPAVAGRGGFAVPALAAGASAAADARGTAV